MALLHCQRFSVLLCERQHADGSCEDLLDTTAALASPPNIIVFSRLADESLWAQVLNMGGFDVLITSFEPQEVLRVTFAAWSRWECDFCGAPSRKQMGGSSSLLPCSFPIGPHCFPREDLTWRNSENFLSVGVA